MRKSVLFTLLLFVVMMVIPGYALADQVHRVAPGETVHSIAKKYSITASDIIQKNYLRNPNNIQAKQVLIIPKVAARNTHKVQAGETLYIISQKYGVTMSAIAQQNQLTDWNRLYVGQLLTIPKTVNQPQNSATYIVKPGDTLYRISQQLGVTMSDLANHNRLTNWNQLYVGQVLKVPSTVRQPEPSFNHTVSQLAAMFPGTFYLKGSGNSNRIALTFDDGPDPTYTPRVLNVLKAHNVPATFFLMGNRAEKYPDQVRRMVREGHIIGNHTWSHPDLRKVSESRFPTEIQQTENTLRQITGLRTNLMRPPYGAVSKEVLEKLRNLNYRVINWSVDSNDWRDQTVDQILINTLTDVREEGVLLFHSAGGEGQSMAATVDALPELIHTLRAQGYTFVTLDKLLGIPAYK